MNDNPAACCTALSARTEGTPDNSFYCQIKVCIIHDNDGIFTAHFQRYLFQLSAAGCRNVSSYFVRTGERNYPNIFVFHHPVSDLGTGTEDNIQYPFRKSSLFTNFCQFISHNRRFSSRFPNYRISGNDGREGLPCRNSNREIPRGNNSDNTNWSTLAHGKFIF